MKPVLPGEVSATFGIRLHSVDKLCNKDAASNSSNYANQSVAGAIRVLSEPVAVED